MWRFFVVIVEMLLCIPTLSFGNTQQVDLELQKQFFQGIRKAERDFGNQRVRANFEYTSRWTSLSPKSADLRKSKVSNVEAEILTEVAMYDGFFLESGKDPKSGNDFVRAKNNTYVFSIAKSKSKGIASLDFVEQLGFDQSVDRLVAEKATYPRLCMSGAYHLWNDSLFEIIKYDSFVVERVYRVEGEGSECVRVEFSYDVGDPNGVFGKRISNGFLVSDPQRNWALTKYGGSVYTLINKSTFKTEAVLEYSDNRSGFPIPSRSIQQNTWPDNRGTVLESELTAKNVTNKVSKEEFYLSYYGLPEPKFGSSWYGNWVWFLMAGIGAITFTVFLRKRRLN